MIIVDATSNSGYKTGVSNYTFSHVCSGENRILIVGVSMLSVAGSSVTSITYAGTALTKIRNDTSGGGTVRTELWYLVAPSLGSNTVEVTLSGILDNVAGAVSLNGVDQANPIDAHNGNTGTATGTDATMNLTTVAADAMVVDVVATDDTAITVGAGQTSRWNVSGTLGSGAGSNEPKDTPGSVTMSWTDVGALQVWTISAVSLKPSIYENILNIGSVGTAFKIKHEIFSY